MSDPADSSNNRRSFTRVPFDAWVELRQGERAWNAVLLDISLKGLLIATPEQWAIEPSQPFTAAVRLGSAEAITMRASLAHQHDGRVGFRCEHIDLESITHLRRLLELNLGNTALVERELAELGRPN